MATYRTMGSCSREIIFQVNENNELVDVKFLGGCSGNQQAISRLIKGRNVDEIIEMLKGIKCRNGTSCPDQLSKALIDYKNKNNEPEEDNEDEDVDFTVFDK